jgi:hypothetical protein
MPAIDLKALNWTNLFREYPQYPEILTQKNWDSKKGKIAKMAGTTGMGDQGARAVDVKKNKDDAIAFIKGGPIKNLHEELKNLRDLAKKTAERFKKNKLIPSSATKLCEEVREAADMLYVVTGTNTLTGHLETALREHQESLIAAQKKQAGNVVTLCKTVPNKVLKAVADWRKVLKALANNEEKLAEARPTLKSNMYSRARDMTQAIANFDKCEKAGVEWENYDSRGIQALAKTLVAYGDGSGVDLTGLSAEEIEKHVKVIEDGAKTFDQLTKNIKIKGT